MSAHGALGQIQGRGDLDKTQAGKEMPLDDARQLRVRLFQVLQRRVDFQQFVQRPQLIGDALVQLGLLLTATMALRG